MRIFTSAADDAVWANVEGRHRFTVYVVVSPAVEVEACVKHAVTDSRLEHVHNQQRLHAKTSSVSELKTERKTFLHALASHQMDHVQHGLHGNTIASRLQLVRNCFSNYTPGNSQRGQQLNRMLVPSMKKANMLPNLGNDNVYHEVRQHITK